MQIVSIEFILFCIITVVFYYLLPAKWKTIWLCLVSVLFYAMQSLGYLFCLFAVAIVSYWAALWLEKKPEGHQKGILYGAIIFDLILLGYFKYAGFFSGGKIQSIILPVGISFYVFMATGYVIDVYRGDYKAERNFINYMLFLSFFPIILSGPIERAAHLLEQFHLETMKMIHFRLQTVKHGLLRMLWGYFMKLVIADRIAIVVKTVYGMPEQYGGWIVFGSACLYTLQIYFDFAGYTNIAIGLAETMSISITENFKCPYLATSISDFWRRWHISLSTWFRDYVYIPLGGNRKGEKRKYCNIMIVFLLSGLWHGAGWTFILWGGLHGLYQVIGRLLKSFREKLCNMLGIQKSSVSLHILQVVNTFFYVTVAWMLFQVSELGTLLALWKRFLEPQFWQLFDGTIYNLGLSRPELCLTFWGILLIFLVDVCNEKGIYLIDRLESEHILIRWPVYIGGILVVLICGLWGSGLDMSSFIYYRF